MMSKTFSVDANNDLYLGVDGNVAVVTDLDALVEICAHVCKKELGECVLNTDQGIPNFQTVFVGTPNIPAFEAALRKSILAIEGVTEVVSLLTERGADSLLTYTITIRTIYGQGTING